MEECIFCRIVAGDLPSTRIHEDDGAIAIMDINPATRGHVLVIPRRHSRDLGDIEDEDLAHCAGVARDVAARDDHAVKRRGRVADGLPLPRACHPPL
jgi:histidine triad (HIT) family protein